jgi:Spy/CpxP family protein refolding chaperone
VEFNGNSRKAFALVALVFMLGAAFGVAGMLATRRVLGAGDRVVRVGQPSTQSQLIREMNLSADQERQFRQILAETRDRYDAIRNAMDPQMREVRQQSRDRIREILTPEQRPGFEQFLRSSRGRRNDRNDRNDRNAGDIQTSQNRPEEPFSTVTRLTQELQLSPEQQSRLTEILRDTRSRFDALRQQMNPQFEEARLQNRERLRQIVTAEQRPILDSFFQRRDQARGRNR